MGLGGGVWGGHVQTKGIHILEIRISGSSCHGSAETNLTSIHEDAGSIPGLIQSQTQLRSDVAVAVA